MKKENSVCGRDIYYIVLKNKGGAVRESETVKENGKVKRFNTPDAALKHINLKMGGSRYTSIKAVCRRRYTSTKAVCNRKKKR